MMTFRCSRCGQAVQVIWTSTGIPPACSCHGRFAPKLMVEVARLPGVGV
jgi:DNA-directed RNA polymerase subunit RPC12/RpoP